MIELEIENFRSIRKAKMDIAPITILYGPNGSGKSTLLYAPLIMKNIILNPNQAIDNFFNLTFSNMGGFEQVIYQHDKRRTMTFKMKSNDKYEIQYEISLGNKDGSLSIYIPEFMKKKMSILTNFPYPLNQNEKINILDLDIPWNGITAQGIQVPEEKSETIDSIIKSINSIPEVLRRVNIVPLKRGFTKPSYSPVNLSSNLLGEDEVATIMANDRYLEGRVQSFANEIFKKNFQVRPQIGTALFYLQMTDEKGMTSELVNEGFGINQSIFLFAKMLNTDTSILCLEEPEIHLHPSAQRKLSKAFIRAVKDENKTIILSTHSEHILMGFLSSVAKGELSPDEISCYFVKKQRRETKIEKQEVNNKGQIEGGLASFMEAEIDNLKDLLKPRKIKK